MTVNEKEKFKETKINTIIYPPSSRKSNFLTKFSQSKPPSPHHPSRPGYKSQGMSAVLFRRNERIVDYTMIAESMRLPKEKFARGNHVTFQHHRLYCFNLRREENLLSTTALFCFSQPNISIFRNNKYLFSAQVHFFAFRNSQFLLSAPQHFCLPSHYHRYIFIHSRLSDRCGKYAINKDRV